MIKGMTIKEATENGSHVMGECMKADLYNELLYHIVNTEGLCSEPLSHIVNSEGELSVVAEVLKDMRYTDEEIEFEG